MPEAKVEVVDVRCPECHRFILKGTFGRIETVCGDSRCRASFVVTVAADGRATIEILRRKRRA